MRSPAEIRAEILSLAAEYHAAANPPKPYVKGDRVRYSGMVWDEAELTAAVGASLDFWLTLGPHAEEFEKRLATVSGQRYALYVNSGSSANLLAVAALGLQPGDEVITVAAGFPTTVNPIVQMGGVPVFCDVTLDTANIDVRQLEAALSMRTKAVIVAHALGNPVDIAEIKLFCATNNLLYIEDNCDGLGSLYDGKPTGSFGDISTSSFFPAHHITTGEGGAVYTSDPRLKMLLESLRDWGRSCWCAPGKENTCGQRFCFGDHGSLPDGYDHKYTYSNIGYNLKPTDIQAAIGVEQLKKLPAFCDRRRVNHARLLQAVQPYEELLHLPVETKGSDPAWFGFLIGVRPEAPFTCRELIAHLEGNGIQTRPLFAGNLTRQPAYKNVRYRLAESLVNTDRIMNDFVFLGVYPGLDKDRMDYQIEVLTGFLASKRMPGFFGAAEGDSRC